MSAASLFTVLAGILAVITVAVYIFGIPEEWRRAAEEKALETMGENKASYMMKDTISRIPASNQKEVDGLKDTVGGTLGGALQNPLGKGAGNAADDATSPLTGR